MRVIDLLSATISAGGLSAVLAAGAVAQVPFSAPLCGGFAVDFPSAPEPLPSPDSPIPVDRMVLYGAGGDRDLAIIAQCNATLFVPADASDAERILRTSLPDELSTRLETVEVEATSYGWRVATRVHVVSDGAPVSYTLELHLLNLAQAPAPAPGSFVSAPLMMLVAMSPQPSTATVVDDVFASARFVRPPGPSAASDPAAPGSPVPTDYAPEGCDFSIRFPRVPLVTGTGAVTGAATSMAEMLLPGGMLKAECLPMAPARDVAAARAMVRTAAESFGMRLSSDVTVDEMPYGRRARAEIVEETDGSARHGILQLDMGPQTTLFATALFSGSAMPELAAFLASAAPRDAPDAAATEDAAAAPALGDDGWHETALPGGMTIELPYGVVTGSGRERLALLHGYETVFDARIARGDPLVPLTVMGLGSAGVVGFIVDLSRNPDYSLGQDDVRAWSEQPDALAGVDARLRARWEDGSRGDVLVEWQGSNIVETPWGLALETRYRWHVARSEQIMQSKNLRVFDGERSFRLTIEYDEALADQLIPVAERVAGSLRSAAE